MLRNENFTNTTYKTLPKTKSTPRPYQKDAIKDVVKGFKTHDRGKLIMACRTGKTPTSMFIAEKMYKSGHKGVTLFVAPSLMLLRQTKDEWLKMANINYKFGIVCSDKNTGKTEDGDISIEELGVKGLGVAQDIDAIKEMLRTKGRLVIFSTYQSLFKIAKVLRHKEFKDFSFDLGIADEAHRTATDKGSLFADFHKNSKIRINKRLYMTATPRVLGGSGEQAKVIHCMDNEKTYGPELHTLSFKKAIELDVIRDYRILATETTPEKKVLKRVLSSLAHLKLDKYLLDGDIVCSVLATERTIKERKTRKVFAFFSNINRAIAFKETYKVLYPDRIVDEVSSRDKSTERARKLNEFKNGKTQVLANAKLLTEGITVGDGDLVVFGDGKNSTIDIVQAISRVLNKSEGRKCGFVLLPLNNPEENKTNTFDSMVAILRALRGYDEVLKSEIEELRKGLTLDLPKDGDESGPKIIFELNKGQLENGVLINEINRAISRSDRANWTPELIQKEALKYKTRSEFKSKCSGAYNAALRLGILDSVCSHMENVYKSWNEESIKKEALKYKTRGEFKKKSSKAYDAALRLGILDSVCSHMENVYKSWNEESIKKEALKYTTRNEFQKKSRGAYSAAHKRGILDSVCSHMQKVLKSWNEESIRKEALKYKIKKDFEKKSQGGYRAAKRLGILDSVCSHMENVYKSWNEESIRKEALKYKTRKEFESKCRGAYNAARRLKILDSVCSHMQRVLKSWNEESIRKEALKYKTRIEFKKKGPKAYDAAYRRGILDSVCSHMKKRGK